MVVKRKTASALLMEKNNKLMLKIDREREKRRITKLFKRNFKQGQSKTFAEGFQAGLKARRKIK